MNWDDLRFVLAVSRAGSLVKAAKALGVDHTTVARRVETLEDDLGVRLFARTPSGYVPTAEADALLPEMTRVEEAALGLERAAHAQGPLSTSPVRVTSPETFGAAYLAPRLARFATTQRASAIELVMGGAVLDLARREADVAVRFFRSDRDGLVVRRAGELGHALYASREYLRRRPIQSDELAEHPLLAPAAGPGVVEAAWLERITRGARPVFTSNLTSALLEAAIAGAGVTVLPRYLGDARPELARIARDDEPKEAIYLALHRDLKTTPRVRAVVDWLKATIAEDAKLLLGG